MNTSLQQNLPNFQLKKTSDIITSKSGLSIFHEAAMALGVGDSIKRNLLKPGSNRGFKPAEYIMPLTLMLCGGGKEMEDIREIKIDKGLRELCGFKRVPSADAVGQWIRKDGNLEGLRKVNEDFIRQVITRSGKDNFTVDTDATFIETGKECAEMTYKGFTAFSSLLSFIADIDLCVCDDYRNGAKHAGSGIEEQIIHTHQLLKSLGKNFKYFRSDSAAYKADVFNFCEDKKIIFTIAADQDKAVKEAIRAIPETAWKKLCDEDGNDTGRQYAETVHCMNKTKNAFTLIVQRWVNRQPDLFEQDLWRHYIIATNNYKKSSPEIIRFHNKRGNSENYNKEVKNGFGMEYAPSRILEANGVYFRLGMLAYNLTVAVKRLFLGDNWIKKTISTLRWQMIFVAGKVVKHGRQLYLKIAEEYFDLYAEIRQKIASVAQTEFS